MTKIAGREQRNKYCDLTLLPSNCFLLGPPIEPANGHGACDTGHVSQPPGARDRLGKDGEWIWRTNRNVLRTGWVSHHAEYNSLHINTCLFFFLMQLESPKDILDFMRFSLHISNTTPTVWDDTWLNFVSFSPHSKLSELCLFFQFYRWKADSEKLNVSLSGRGRTHASPTWQLLNGFSILPSWKVTTEIDWQKSMLARLGFQPCNYQRWDNLEEIPSTESPAMNQVYCWSNNMCLPLSHFFFFFSPISWPPLQHVDVPGPRTESEPQLQQCQILKPLWQAGDWTWVSSATRAAAVGSLTHFARSRNSSSHFWIINQG